MKKLEKLKRKLTIEKLFVILQKLKSFQLLKKKKQTTTIIFFSKY